VGSDALQANSTGSQSTAVGYRAGYSQNGIANTFVGYQAGYSGSTGNSRFNVYVGALAGYSATGEGNSFMGAGNNTTGYPAGYLITSGANNVVIGGFGGNSAGLDIRTASNYIVLSDGDGNPLISTNSTRSVALNGAVPQTGTGITFPATQSASSNANTLDDYEEGTWTPSLGGTAVYDIRTGTYTKIGNVVSITGSIRPSSLGTGSTNTLTGLPFTAAADAFCGIPYGDGFAVSVYSVHLYIYGTTLEVRGFTAASASTSLINLFATNTRIYFSATYQV